MCAIVDIYLYMIELIRGVINCLHRVSTLIWFIALKFIIKIMYSKLICFYNSSIMVLVLILDHILIR